MKELISLRPTLAIAITMNIAAGMYYNIGTRRMHFELSLLASGLLKAAIVTFMFIGTAYCFDATDLSATGVTPMFIMTSAIGLYVGKAMISLGKILGVNITATNI